MKLETVNIPDTGGVVVTVVPLIVIVDFTLFTGLSQTARTSTAPPEVAWNLIA